MFYIYIYALGFFSTDFDGITDFITDMSERISHTTQKSTETVTSSRIPIYNPLVPYAVLFIIIASVCIFLVLFAFFVGVYFYKHCFKQTAVFSDAERQPSSNSNEEYKSLGRLKENQAIGNFRNSAYLEPVFIERPHYDEIEDT